jgi:putative ABC transport system ATP-binding protein
VSGSVKLDGQTANEIGWPQFRRQVMLVQQRPVMLDASIEDNLAAPFAYHHIDRGFSIDEAKCLLERLLLGSVPLSLNARSLSEGQQQRASIIRAVLLKPRVLLLDEPTSALDEAATEALDALLREWVNATDAAVLMIRHDIAAAHQVSDETIDLRPSRPPTQAESSNGAAPGAIPVMARKRPSRPRTASPER